MHVCRAMTDIKDLSSTAIYAWTTLVSVLICVPGALIFEGPKLQAGIDAALKKEPNFYLSLLSVGLLYHLYNQVRAQARILCHRMSRYALVSCLRSTVQVVVSQALPVRLINCCITTLPLHTSLWNTVSCIGVCMAAEVFMHDICTPSKLSARCVNVCFLAICAVWACLHLCFHLAGFCQQLRHTSCITFRLCCCAVCLQHIVSCDTCVTWSVQCGQEGGHHWNICCLLWQQTD